MFDIADYVKLRKKVHDNNKTPNAIPHNIHLFWTGKTIPEKEVTHILSFLKYIPDPIWKVNLWLTDFNHLTKATYFNNLEPSQFPKNLHLRHINELLDDQHLFHKLKKLLYVQDNWFPFTETIQIINRESIGLGNPAAAKDAVVPMILFAEGGYYFDLDSKAVTKINPPKVAPYGILILNEGNIVAALAAEKEHPFCAFNLAYLLVLYSSLKREESFNFAKTSFLNKHHFFECQILRNRNNPIRRASLTIQTSGEIIAAAYREWLDTVKNKTTLYPNFLPNTHLRAIDDYTLDLGVKLHLKQTGDWRDNKKFPSFDDTAMPATQIHRFK